MAGTNLKGRLRCVGLTDTGLASQQADRSGRHAATEDPIELGQVQGDALLSLLTVSHGDAAASRRFCAPRTTHGYGKAR